MNVSARQIATVQDKRVIAAIRTVQCIPYGSPNLVRRNAICCTRQMSGSRTLLVVGLLLASLVVASGRAPPPFTTKYFDQYLDHFNYESQPQTFKQRYLIADQYWGTVRYNDQCKGPIFFYTGNEAPVTEYSENSGLFTEVLAPKYGGLLIFAEHRYFGESMPFGNSSFQPGKIGFLSTDQALADYAVLIGYLKTTLGAQSCPVIAFGGSYGGMLTAWFRLKYPNVVIGGLAASAPFAFPGSGISPFAFALAATNTFATAGPGCDKAISSAVNTMMTLANTQQGRKRIGEAFKLCSGTPPTPDAAYAVIDWVTNGLAGMAMLDYPYATNYGISLPAWPVNATCNRILNFKGDPIAGLAYAIGVFYNNTGTWSCYDINKDIPAWGGCCGWDYLHCTEVYLPFASTGIFPFAAYNLSADIAACQQEFGITLRPEWPNQHWGSFDSLKAATNIIFSNGLLDPWHTSGVLQSISSSLIAVVIPESAHHFDLRGPRAGDPIYVTQARMREDSIIGGWIRDYFNKH